MPALCNCVLAPENVSRSCYFFNKNGEHRSMIYSRLCSTLCSPDLLAINFIFFATEKDPSLHNEYKSSKKSKEKSHHHHRSDKHEGGSTEHRERSEDKSEKGHRSVEKSSKHDKSHHKSGEKSHQKSSGDHHHHHHKKHKDHREHKDKVIIIIRRETTENTMMRKPGFMQDQNFASPNIVKLTNYFFYSNEYYGKNP